MVLEIERCGVMFGILFALELTIYAALRTIRATKDVIMGDSQTVANTEVGRGHPVSTFSLFRR
jgi:hypothetical protein